MNAKVFQYDIRPILVIGLSLLAGIVSACNLESPAEDATVTSAQATISFLEAQLTPGHSQPFVGISFPQPGQELEQGKPVNVQYEATDEQGISRVELLVDGQIVSANDYIPQPGSVFVAKVAWIPDTPGAHALQVRAYNPANTISNSDSVVVQVTPAVALESPTMTPTSTPAQPTASPTHTPTQRRPSSTGDIIPSPTLPATTPTPSYAYLIIRVEPGLNVREGPSTRYRRLGSLHPGDMVEIRGQNDIGAGRWWQIRFDSAANGVGWVTASADYSESFNTGDVAIVAAPPTPAPPTPTLTPTPVPVVQQTSIEFGTDRPQINRGECATVYWNVTNVLEVYYRGYAVPGENQSRLECPTLTESYELRVVRYGGEVESRTIKIEVVGTENRSLEMDLGDSVDFDKDGKVSKNGDDFIWEKDNDKRYFRKWDNDDDLKLVPVGPFDLDMIGREDCEWALDHLNDTDEIKPFAGLAACFRTDERKIGKLRFQDADDNADIEWALW